MDLDSLINDKTLRPKEKTQRLADALLDGRLQAGQLVGYAIKAKDPVKATCIEALEFASRQQPGIADKNTFEFVSQNLRSKAPRVKWESAKVIGNTARLFADQLDQAIPNLLDNALHSGTVVRWSAAFALGEILKLGTSHNKTLRPAIESLSRKEEKNSIQKIYQAALKKTAS